MHLVTNETSKRIKNSTARHWIRHIRQWSWIPVNISVSYSQLLFFYTNEVQQVLIHLVMILIRPLHRRWIPILPMSISISNAYIRRIIIHHRFPSRIFLRLWPIAKIRRFNEKKSDLFFSAEDLAIGHVLGCLYQWDKKFIWRIPILSSISRTRTFFDSTIIRRIVWTWSLSKSDPFERFSSHPRRFNDGAWYESLDIRCDRSRSMQSKVCTLMKRWQYRHVYDFRIREKPDFVQSIRSLPTYGEIPLSIREYLEYGSKPTLQPSFDPLRTLTPTSTLPMGPSMTNNIFSRMTTGLSPIGNQAPQSLSTSYTANSNGGNGLGREAPGQRGVSHRRSYRVPPNWKPSIVLLAFIDSRCQYSNVDQWSRLYFGSSQTTTWTRQW